VGSLHPRFVLTPIRHCVLFVNHYEILPDSLLQRFLVVRQNNLSRPLKQIPFAVVEPLWMQVLNLKLCILVHIMELIQNELDVGWVLVIDSAGTHRHRKPNILWSLGSIYRIEVNLHILFTL
jgi:hypothetical protein